MKSDLQKILESKRKKRKQLAELSVSEKLAMLDVLRDREILINESYAKYKKEESDKNKP
jgi:hypothetical protein